MNSGYFFFKMAINVNVVNALSLFVVWLTSYLSVIYLSIYQSFGEGIKGGIIRRLIKCYNKWLALLKVNLSKTENALLSQYWEYHWYHQKLKLSNLQSSVISLPLLLFSASYADCYLFHVIFPIHCSYLHYFCLSSSSVWLP